MESALDITSQFVVLDQHKSASVENNDAELYPRLQSNYGDFNGHELISCHDFTTSWDTWEKHPHGDEIVILLSGEATFLLQLESGVKQINLKTSGEYVLVPKDTWHSANISTPARLLFITPGEGTENKDR